MTNDTEYLDNLSPKKRHLFELLIDENKSRHNAVQSQKIEVRRDSSPPPLSFAQQRLWFFDQLTPNSPVYNLPMAKRLTGHLDLVALERTISEIVRRHESLRTTFATIDGKPVQVIAEAAPVKLTVEDLRWLPEEEREPEALRLAREEAQQPFDLSRGPLLRVRLLRLAERDHAALFTMHHIVLDGWSMGIMMNELSALYRAYRQGEEPRLPELPIQYADYAVWQHQWMSSEVLERQAEYWKRTLSGAPALLELPADRARPAQRDYAGEIIGIKLEEGLTSELKALSRRHGTTLYMTLLACWAALLARLSGQEEVVIGTPVANRTRTEIEGLIGFFVNTLALRIDLSGSPSVGELLGRVKARALEGQQNQEIPFEQVVEIVLPPRSLSHDPIFQAVFAWQNAFDGSLDLPGMAITAIDVARVTATFDLRLALLETGHGFEGTLEYAAALFDRSTMERWLGYWRTLLEGMASAEEQIIDRLPLLGEAERRQLLEEWNRTEADHPAVRIRQEKLIHELFEEQVEQSPDAIALAHEEQSLSYGELNALVNRLARHLRELGVGPEVRVAICLERSLEMVVALLATLKAGGAYLPLASSSPLERLSYMLEDSVAAVLLTHEAALPAPVGHSSALLILNLDGDAWQWAGQSERNPDRAATGVDARSLAYVIYTSGSTGLPKGVLAPHRGLCNLAEAQRRAFGIGPDSRVLQFASLSFDASVSEIFVTLAAGATLYLPAPTEILSGSDLLRLIRDRAITTMTIPPSVLSTLPEESLPELRTLVVAGEACPAELARVWGRGRRLLNAYGPTEATVCATMMECAQEEGVPPIGKPIANTRVYILDAQMNPAPIAVRGELYIAGVGLARCYTNRAALTAERFLPDPYGLQPGGRLYRTGDLGRWRPEGEIEFLGRNDFQVKIRGFRIELGEIEAVLNEHQSVKNSVVVAREDEHGGKRLFGYVVGEKEATSAELKRYLKERLPQYMVPVEIMILEEMPILPSGKIDHNALLTPDIVRPELDVTYIAPRTELERMIAAVWEELLQLKQVGIHDNFFDLGANSLVMVAAAAKLQEIIQRELPVVMMFQYPTISALAAYLNQGDADESSLQQKGDFTESQEGRVVARGQDERTGIVTRVVSRADHSDSTALLRRPSDIAIIGMSGRFPQAPTIDIFWRNLCDAREAISSLSDSQLLAAGVDPGLLADTRYIKAAASLDGIDLFDAPFFGFSPREAEILDPQHRLFLQAAWHALESAGYVPDRFPGLIGLFAGAGSNSYLLAALRSNSEVVEAVGFFQAHLSNDKDFLPTRVSYKLNLRGPSIAVQTACSTSLVAVHLACQSLLQGECDLAISGGVTIAVPHNVGYLHQEGGIASSDGHCRAFDAQASGTIDGSGLGIVVLKRLAEARADGDNVLAVIKGSAVNNDGSGKVGYTAPSIDGQARVIADAQAVAGVDPATITYIEAHGTGTALGDPVEIAALTQAFRVATDRRRYCAIGSVKTNVGHLDAAAGVTGLIKTVLALKHRQIPASLHFERPNPQIDFASSPFYVNPKLQPWESNGAPRRAGVSSFGIGGTNAHVILEEAPEVERSEVVESPQLLVLSARSEQALTTMAAQLAEHLRQNPELNLADVAFTLREGRKAFAHRLSLVCGNLAEAVSLLEKRGRRRVYRAVAGERARSVVYMFPGQGAQYVGMGRELYEQEPAYGSVIDQCAELAMEVLGIDLRRVLYPGPGEEAGARGLIDQTNVTQVSLFAVELGLARMWQNKGVQPVAMIGHSLGEYVAGCLAGVLSEEQAIKLVAKRGALMQRARPGAMLAVSLSEDELGEALCEAGSRLEVAAVNGPQQCVLSGEEEAIAKFERRLSAARIASKQLKTSRAFHSRLMEEVVGEFEREVEKMELRRPAIRYISNVSGKWITAGEAQEAGYWGRQMRAPVRYWEGLKQIEREIEEPVLLEVGPGDSLSQLARRLNGENRRCVVTTLRGESEGATRALLEAVGRMWAHGVEIEWKKWRKGKRRRVELPGYAFEEKRFWVKGVGERAVLEGVKRKEGVGGWFYSPVWKETAPVINREEGDQSQAWLILEDEGGIGERIVAELERRGCVVTRVKKANWYERRGEREYWIRVGEAGDYKAVLKEMEARGESLGKIVHLFSLDCGENEHARGGEERIKQAEEAGFYSLAYLAQGLGQRKGAQEVEVVVVSNGVAEVIGEEEVRAEKAVALGPVRVMRQECPQVRSRFIDVMIPPPGAWQEERLIKQLLSELRTKSADLMIAYRGNHRWRQSYEAAPFAPAPVGAGLRPAGVYLITGGLGGIGMVLADYLAHSVKARLALIGREGLPERSEWDRLMRQVEVDEKLRRKICKIKEWEEAGAKVEVIRADVSEETEIREAVGRTQQMFGPINGVIHAAGVTDKQYFHLLQDITPANSSPLFRPKIHGLLVLEKVFRDLDLDFCLLCSSLSSVLGGIGFAAYSGSNIFMDAFVSRKNRSSPVPWISINWDGWQLRQEDFQQRAGFGSSQAELAIKPKEGIEAFQRIISAKLAGQVIVSTADLQSRIRQWVDLESLQGEQLQTRPASLSEHARPELQTDYIAPRNDLERSIAAIWQNLLGLKQVGVEDDFFELGGHSLLAIQYLSRLRQNFQVEIPMRSFFERPTVAGQAEIIEVTLITEIEALTEEEVAALQSEERVS